MKTLDENFVDWEQYAFGFGYGTGEEHIIPALKQFLGVFRCNTGPLVVYDFRELEAAMDPTAVWLLINAMCKAGVIEYGTSPRFGFLTKCGAALKEYMDGKTACELLSIIEAASDEYARCTPHYCNCGPNGYVEGKVCDNPFWVPAS